MSRLRRSEAGFGLVELLIAMTVLAAGITALVAGFTSGYLALSRASVRSTAGALADAQMEKYRALDYSNIGLTWSGYDSTYTTDAACTDTSSYGSGAVTCATASTNEGATVSLGSCTFGAACTTVQTVTGPDNRSYRVDSYIRRQTPTSGRALKLVTVVVRSSDASTAYVRIQSAFDACTGLTNTASTC